jgi:hypothetical protein
MSVIVYVYVYVYVYVCGVRREARKAALTRRRWRSDKKCARKAYHFGSEHPSRRSRPKASLKRCDNSSG